MLSMRFTPRFSSRCLACRIAGPVRLERALAEPMLELLAEEGTRWRPVHDLVAKEVIEQVLAGSATDRSVWVQALSTWAADFIEMCSGGPHQATTSWTC
jgi:hypothetical protein